MKKSWGILSMLADKPSLNFDRLDAMENGCRVSVSGTRHRIARAVQMLLYWPVYLLLRFFVRYEVRGQENLKGYEDKALILASNHASYLDGALSALSMPRRKGELYPKDFFPIRFLVLDRFFRWRYLLVALFVRATGSIKLVKYGGDLKKSLSQTLAALRRGEKVWIYPEGRLSPDGKLRQGRRGVAYLHRETGAAIVPVGITGNFGILSFATLLRRKNVRVSIGRPIHSLDNPGSCTLETGVAKVMTAIQQLLDEKA